MPDEDDVTVRTVETSDNRSAVYQDDDTGLWVFRGSGLGSCFSHLVRCGLGYTPSAPPASLLDRFQEGKVAEPVILKWLNDYGGVRVEDDWWLDDRYTLVDGQVELEIPVGKSAIIRLHPDGIGTIYKTTPEDREQGMANGSNVVLEAKAFGPDYYKKWKREGLEGFPFYKYQVSAEIAASGFPCVFIIGEKDEQGVVYPDACKRFYIAEPPVPLAQLKLKVMRVLKAIELGDIPECDWAMFPCGFWQEHNTDSGVWAKIKGVDAATVDVEVDLLASLAEQYELGKEMEKDGKDKKKSATKGIIVAFDSADQKGGTLTAKGYEVKDYCEPRDGNVDWEALVKGEGLKVTDAMRNKYRGDGYEIRYPKIKHVGDESG